MTAVEYSPYLQLQESYRATYYIYALVDPRNDDVFYIGITKNSIKSRLYQHIQDALSERGNNKIKCHYIKSIIDSGNEVLIKELEVVNGTCYAHKIEAEAKEYHWVQYYKKLGAKLLNIVGLDKVCDNSEYVTYLSAIKKDSTKWSYYYYCGKTEQGQLVYDVKKMNEDGFSFKTNESYYGPVEYNPWENERFLKMLGIRDIADKYTYEPVYRDLDPNYYDDDY